MSNRHHYYHHHHYQRGSVTSNPTRKPMATSSIPGASHSGHIKLSTGPIICHSCPLKDSVITAKLHPSIFPAGFVGRKKHPGFTDVWEPSSPHVTCLGRVKTKQNFCIKEMEKPMALAVAIPVNKEERRKKKDPDGRKKNKVKEKEAVLASAPLKSGSSCLSRKHSRSNFPRAATSSNTVELDDKQREDFTIDLSRFGNASECVDQTGRQRAAFLARCLVNLLQQSCLFEEENSDEQHVPQIPPPNCLILMRGSRNLEQIRNQLGAGSRSENLNERISLSGSKKAAMAARCQVSLPKPTLEASLWQRRASAKPFALDVTKPVKLEIEKPTMR